MIEPKGKNLSIIITGKFGENSFDNIQKVIKCYSMAEIVVVSFAAPPVKFRTLKVKFAKINDPGPSFVRLSGHVDNFGRQIAQISRGLSLTKRRVVLRLRTDMTLNEPLPIHFLAEEKINIPTIFTRNPTKYPLLFHPSDLCALGLRETIQNFYWSSLVEIDSNTQKDISPKKWMPLGNNSVFLFPEQRLFLNYLKSLEPEIKVDLPYATYFDFEAYRLSENLMFKHFNLIPDGWIVFPKKFLGIRPGVSSNYTLKEWAALAKPQGQLYRYIRGAIQFYLITNLRFSDIKSKVNYFLRRDKNIYY
jgi:hypothetical protein